MAWVYSFGLTDTSFTSGPTGTAFQPQNFVYGGRVTFSAAGDVTMLGVRCMSYDATRNLKIGLYTTGGTLVAQSTSTVSSGTGVWADSGSISAAVSAGDYIILVSADTQNVGYFYNTGQNGSFATETYSTAMASSETITLEGDTGFGYGVRADFTESASVPIAALARNANQFIQRVQ